MLRIGELVGARKENIFGVRNINASSSHTERRTIIVHTLSGSFSEKTTSNDGFNG